MIWSRNSAASWLLKISTTVLCAASGANYKWNFKFSKANSTVILRNVFSTEECIQQQWKFECWKASSVVIFRSTLSSKLTFENLYRGSARGVWRQAEILKSQLAGYMCHVKSLYKWHSRIFTSAAWIPTARVLPPLKLLKVGSVASLCRACTRQQADFWEISSALHGPRLLFLPHAWVAAAGNVFSKVSLLIELLWGGYD